MKKKEKIETITEVVTDVICDSCGESCKVNESLIDNEKNPDYGKTKYSFEYLVMEAGWGFNSNKDLEHWTADVCEKCVDDKLSFIDFSKKQMKFSTTIR